MKPFRFSREDVKLFVWDHGEKVNNTLRIISLLVSFFTIGVIVYYYGFKQTEQSRFVCEVIIRCSLIFYTIKYGLNAFFSMHPMEFLKKTKLECFVVSIIILWFITTHLFNINLLGFIFSNEELLEMGNITMILIQIYFFVIVVFELSNMEVFLNKIHWGPGGWMIASFLIIISLGTILLSLPEMTTNKISFIDALFTSTSASCVSGLTVVEVSHAFTFKGQFVILLLMQAGGINILCFATFLSSFYLGSTLKRQSVLKEMLNTSLRGTKVLMREILLYTFVIEIIGFLAFFFYWNHTHLYSDSILENIFLSAFHSIASFNNAGLSIIENGMNSIIFQHDYYIQSITMFLIFLGGIGFITIHNMLECVRNNPNKISYWARLQVMTRVTIKMTLLLIGVGAISFFILEYNNIYKDASLSEKIYTSIFTSVSTRTAGFSIIDTPMMNLSTALILACLMFIGAAPSSTGGGIKITTFYILIKSALATIRNKKEVTIENRAVSFNIVNRAYTVVLLSVALVMLGCIVLAISDSSFGFRDIFFEVVSALSTSGISMGITSFLSTVGKSTLIILMFIGRITIFTLAVSLARKAIYSNYSLAKTDINI